MSDRHLLHSPHEYVKTVPRAPDPNYEIRPGRHTPNGFPHHSSQWPHHCMCLSKCCHGTAGCRCKSCPCRHPADPVPHDHILLQAIRDTPGDDT